MSDSDELKRFHHLLRCFLQGVDLSNNIFVDCKLPDLFNIFSSLSWLYLKNTNIKTFPEMITSLKNLEQLTIINSDLDNVPNDIGDLQKLKSLILRKNCLQSITPALFLNDNLNTIDLSFNKLKIAPSSIESSKKCLVLNLSNNSLAALPPEIFVEMVDLKYLNVSNNILETIPPQLRRLTQLQTLILNDNPLLHAQLRQITSLTFLKTLHLRGTQRNINNFPTGLDALKFLTDIDLSMNELSRIPDSLYQIETLKKLDISDNEITELSSLIENWQYLEILNLSRNHLTQLSNGICKLFRLRRLYANENELTFEGLPPGIGKLSELEIFSAAGNFLTNVPESLFRCGKLKKIILNANNLVTIPSSYHYLTDLDDLDVRDNPDLELPPKPIELIKSKQINDVYNIDFSLSTHLQKVGKSIPEDPHKKRKKTDTVARKMRLGQRKRIDAKTDDGKSEVVLSGMRRVARDRGRSMSVDSDGELKQVKPKRWDELIVKPKINFTDIFHDEDEIGQFPGLTMWEMDNFLPKLLDEPTNVFYTEDCYIVLYTYIDDHQNLNWKIWHWIGNCTSLDKKAASAIHAVNLRDYLDAKCRCSRQEQAEEDEDFLELFNNKIEYEEGARAESGFYFHDDGIFATRMICVHPKRPPFSVSVTFKSLNSHLSYIIVSKNILWVWNGSQSKINLKSRARLIAEKMNKIEFKALYEIRNATEGAEQDEFWELIGGNDEVEISKDESIISLEFRPILYKVVIQKGAKFVLQQINIQCTQLQKDLLKSTDVYILDTKQDVFIWLGKKTTPTIRKLSPVIVKMLIWSMIERYRDIDFLIYTENMESMLFKLQFKNWDDVIQVDFTRTSESVSKRGIDLMTIIERDQIKTDLNALLGPREDRLDDHESEQEILDFVSSSEIKNALVLDKGGRKKIELKKEEYGHFYSANTYVFTILTTDILPELDEESADDDIQETSYITVYCWQGRDAPSIEMTTLKLDFDLKFNKISFDVVMQQQQQEDPSFLKAFQNKFVIHKGRRPIVPEISSEAHFYEQRSVAGLIYSRMIQIPNLDSLYLNSELCFVLVVPFESGGGVVYSWIGSKASNCDAHNAIEIGNKMLTPPNFSFQALNEGDEPDLFFWQTLGGRKKYDESIEHLLMCRLFRCSNDKGYFTVSEKTIDFCQDDLEDDDVMLLDNGRVLFVWVGPKASRIEMKFSSHAALMYKQHLKLTEPDKPRKLGAALKNREPREFTKCFHAWTHHKSHAVDSIKK